MIYKLPLHPYQITVWVYECKSDSFKKQKVKVICKIKCLFTAPVSTVWFGENIYRQQVQHENICIQAKSF